MRYRNCIKSQTSYFCVLWLSILLVLGCSLAACSSSERHNILNVPSVGATPKILISHEELIGLIDSCWCRDDDDPDLGRILAVSTTELVRTLQREMLLMKGRFDDKNVTAHYLKYSYLLARLGVDAESNTETIVSIASRTSDGHSMSDAIGFLGVLIRRGDKKLLRSVFSLASRSDAGASMEIVEILRKELTTAPVEILSQLEKESKASRKRVLKLIAAIEDPHKEKINSGIAIAGNDNKNLKEISTLVLKAMS